MTKLILFLAAVLPVPAFAQARFSDATIRPTTRSEKSVPAIANVVSRTDDRIVGGTTPVADMVHVHLSRRDKNGVMQMIQGIPLEARQPRRLSPYGYHLMLMGLHQPLTEGMRVPMTVRMESGRTYQVNFRVTAR